jgi:hypothetical protein
MADWTKQLLLARFLLTGPIASRTEPIGKRGATHDRRIGLTLRESGGSMRIKHVITAFLLLGLPALGLADTTDTLDATQLPEPETLALLAIGAVGWAIARWAKRK